MKEKDFSWSLKPLTTFLQFAGIPLTFSSTNKKKLTIIALFFLLAIVSANLFFNGPRGIEISRFQFLERRDDYESSFTYLKENQFAIVKLVGIIADMAFFCYVPFIHVSFVAMILFDPNWKKLIGLLDKIQREMKLDEEFYRKCRRICMVSLFQLAVVSRFFFFFNIFLEFKFLSKKGLGHFWMDLLSIWFEIRLRRELGRKSTETN